MKTGTAFIAVISFCAASVFMELKAQTQSIEAWYGNGLTALRVNAGSPPGDPDLHFGGISYRYMGKKLPLGFSAGIGFSGYPYQGNSGQPAGQMSYFTASDQSIFATLPFMLEGIAGKRRVKFSYNIGFALVCAIKSRFYYEEDDSDYNPYIQTIQTSVSADSAYLHKFQPIQIGIPITGLGIQVNVIKQLYIRVMVENTFYFGVGRVATLSKEAVGTAGFGLFDSFLCKVIIGANFRQR